jgi:hypothetical protein
LCHGHDGRVFSTTPQHTHLSQDEDERLLMLKHEVDNGELLVITNPETLEEIECRIVYLGELCDQGQRVGIEFLTPAPHFWGLEFADQTTPSNESSTVH